MNRIHGRKSYIALPILFSVLTALILYFTVWPTVAPYYSLFSILLTSEEQEEYNGVNLMEQISAGENLANRESISVSEISLPREGDQYGNLTIEGTSVDAPVFYGDGEKQLNQGVGTYAFGYLPGQGGTILMGAHTNTWFSDLGSAKIGSIIKLETNYGVYEYKIVDAQVKDHQDRTAYDFSRTDENIILYTCYPFGTIGFTTQRYFVYGEYVSGPVWVYE